MSLLKISRRHCSGMGWALPRHKCPSKKRRRHTPAEGVGGGAAKAGTRGKDPQQQMLERQEGSSLEAPKGAQPCRHLQFGLLVSRTVHESISIVFSPRQENTLHGETGGCDPSAPPAFILWAGSALGGGAVGETQESPMKGVCMFPTQCPAPR